MTEYIVATTAEIGPGQRKLVVVNEISIGVFNVRGTYYALRNRCPHQGGPLCLGSLLGTALPSQPGEYVWAREGEILRCPWHGWEFDVTTGQSICSPDRVRVRAYDVTVDLPPASNLEPGVETYEAVVKSGNVVLHVPS